MASILVVDDDTVVAEWVAQVLIDAGNTCGWVGDARTAMTVLMQQRPDLLIVDESLPGESGTSLLRRLRGSTQFYDLPVIMLTGKAGSREEKLGCYHGAQDFIRKPFGEKMLRFSVRRLLDRQRGGPAHRLLAQRLGGESAATSLPQPRRI